MNSSSYDLNSSTGMSEPMTESNTTQPLITTNDIDIPNEEKHLLSDQDNSSNNLKNLDQIDNIPLESTPTNITKKKSLVSVYDNSTDGEQQQQINENTLPLIAILGRNQRSKAFTKRLVLSGFPRPILLDINSPETFYQSPSIIVITDNLTNNVEYLFNKQQLVIDARELTTNYLIPIPESYQGFGNLSNWEIENGTERVCVAIEQSSPLSLIKFIHNLNCFPRGITFLDQYSYNKLSRKSFQNCLFPFLSTIIIFSLCFILSIIEDKNIYRQASSITASTSITLLSLLYLIRPILELIEIIFKKKEEVSQLIFVQRWIQSRRYLAWYSLSFAILHIIFILFASEKPNHTTFYPILFGLFTLILLCILSFVYFPWISEYLLWNEYHLLTSYLGPFCLLIGFIHTFIHWKYSYFYSYQKYFFQLKFFSMILPFIVLFLRFIIDGIIHPIMKLSQNRQRINKTSIKDTTILP